MKCLLAVTCFLALARVSGQPIRYVNYGAAQGLSTQWSDCVVRDREGYLWIGMIEGLARYDGIRFKTFHNIPGDTTSLPANRIEELFVDEQGVLWVGTDGGGITRWNRSTESFTRFPESDEYLATMPSNRNPRQVWAAQQAPDGMIWIGSSTGLSLLNPVTKSRIHMPNHYLEGFAETDPRRLGVRSLHRDRFDSTRLWVGTVSGLFEFNTETRTFISHIQNVVRSMHHSNTVRDMWQDDNRVLWLGTFAGGLQRFDPRTGEYRLHFFHTQNDSVPDPANRNIIDAVIPGTGGRLWLATHDKGLVTFDPGSETFGFAHAAGLPSYLLEASADEEGNLWIAHRSGVVRVPDAVTVNPDWRPQLHITEILADGNSYDHDPGSELLLADDTRDIVFSYALLSFREPEMIRYKYMLSGQDAEWVDADHRTFVQYTNLRGGRYTFKLIAIDAQGRNHETDMVFRIHVPFYKTATFRLLSAAAVIGLLALIFWLRVRQVRRQERMKASFEKQLARVEMEALRSQMNPHFLFNALNSLKDLIIRNEPHAASEYLGRFSRLIRLILENSKEQIVSLEQELEAVNLYVEVERQRFENRFDYRLEISNHLDQKRVMLPPMLIQPYVENAIWHGLMHKTDKGMLQVSLRQANGCLLCVIEDNGVGRKKAAELRSKSAGGRKSYGMAITRDRVALVKELYNIAAKVKVEDVVADGVAAGTRVTLSLPLIQTDS